MPSYTPPLADIRFVLKDVLKAETLFNLEGFQDFNVELVDQILEEGGKICAEVLFPLKQCQ